MFKLLCAHYFGTEKSICPMIRMHKNHCLKKGTELLKMSLTRKLLNMGTRAGGNQDTSARYKMRGYQRKHIHGNWKNPKGNKQSIDKGETQVC